MFSANLFSFFFFVGPIPISALALQQIFMKMLRLHESFAVKWGASIFREHTLKSEKATTTAVLLNCEARGLIPAASKLFI